MDGIMLRSMTGFGRCFVEDGPRVQQWEIRSVNSRFLELKWRLPPLAQCLEPELEKLVRKYAGRGRVDISLQLRFTPGNAPKPIFDSGQAMGMIDCLAALARERGDAFIPDFSAFLGVPSLWSEPDSDQDDDLASQLQKGLSLALSDWNESRETEGEALAADLQARVMRMVDWTEMIAERVPEIREDKTRVLRERLDIALAGAGLELDENRFLQEIVILTDRLDVSEEITRLSAHLDRLLQLLRQGGDAGRRLDFTLQECFREINTLGNKVSDAQLSSVVVDFKNELEKCREQARNLE